jgi:hypothetical protein
MAVQYNINLTAGLHRWNVVSAEHAWTHPKTGDHRYVDLVIQHSHDVIFRCAIECKRIKDHGKWVFPILPGQVADARRTSPFFDVRRAEKKSCVG